MSKKETLRKVLSIKTKLLIYEYKEKFPQMSPEEICLAFSIEDKTVKRLFDQEFLIIPSKMNRKR
jgi:hypothetical protein